MGGAVPRLLPRRLATFRRLITFDKRGIGMSDPVSHPSTLEDNVDDLAAVMDAAGSERADIFGVSEGGAMAILFAATHPNRDSLARSLWRLRTHDVGARLPVGDHPGATSTRCSPSSTPMG